MATKKDDRSKTDLSAASKVLQTVLGNGKSPLSDQFLRWKIWRFWPQIVGETVAKYSEPVGYDKRRLYIWVKSSSRMQEIRFFEHTLKKKVNDHVGREWVRSIRFTLDRREVPQAADVSEDFKKYLAEGGPGDIPPDGNP